MPNDPDPNCCCCCDFCTPEKSQISPCALGEISVDSLPDYNESILTNEVCTAIADAIDYKRLDLEIDIYNNTDKTIEVVVGDIALENYDCMDWYFDPEDATTVCLDPYCSDTINPSLYVISVSGEPKLQCCKYTPEVHYVVIECGDSDQEALQLYTSPHQTHALGALSCSGEPNFEDEEMSATMSGTPCVEEYWNYGYWEKLTASLVPCSGDIPECRAPIIEIDILAYNMEWMEIYLGAPGGDPGLSEDISSDTFYSFYFVWCPDESWDLDDVYIGYFPGEGCGYDEMWGYGCDLPSIYRSLYVTCSPCCCCEQLVSTIVTSNFFSMDWENPTWCEYVDEVDLVVCVDESTGTKLLNIDIPYVNDLPCNVQYDITYSTETPGIELTGMNNPTGTWQPYTSGTVQCSGTVSIDTEYPLEGLEDCKDCDPLDNQREVVIKVSIDRVVCECNPGLGSYSRCDESCP